MTARARLGYHFRASAQWKACVFERVDSESQSTGIRPIAPYVDTPKTYTSEGARTPAVTRAGEIVWCDDAGCLHRLSACLEEPEIVAAPHAIARASRLVSMSSGLWVVSESRTSLLRFEEDTLARLASLDVPGGQVIDIAGDSYDALFALIERGGVCQALRIDCSGSVVETVTFEGVSRAKAFVFLRRTRRFVVLTEESHPHLYWFAEKGGAALTSKVVAGLHPCFCASALGSDARSRVFLAGTDGKESGGKSFVLVFDADGEPLSEVALEAGDSPAGAATGTRDSLLITGPRGLLRYATAQAVPDGTAEVRCSLVTPALHSPDREDRRRWLRIEANARLPEGATLEISYASTADAALRKKMLAIAADRSMTAGERAQRILREPGIWHAPIAFHGSDATPQASAAPLAAPLFDVQDPYVWVCVTLTATARGSLPALHSLDVLYPGKSLMENLPAIYRRAEVQPGSFLRSLVGVLEATTQGIDARIAALGCHVNPSTATGRWLDFVARWLALPWDDAIDVERKRRIITHAADLARTRGTRAGLETLLDCLLPGTPPRFRIVDATSDFGFATVGGADCRGSTLPALLGGRTRWSPELDVSAVLGRVRLPCPGQIDDGAWQIAGHIRVDVAVSAGERVALEPWLPALVDAMVPLTARVTLRWLSARALRGTPVVGSLVLEAAPTPHLGSDAIMGVARLPERGSRITATGADIGTRLQ